MPGVPHRLTRRVPQWATAQLSVPHADRQTGDDRSPAYDQFMADQPDRRAWTPEELRREEQAERARVRRDSARGVSENLKDAVAHTEFAKRFADAFKRTRRA